MKSFREDIIKILNQYHGSAKDRLNRLQEFSSTLANAVIQLELLKNKLDDEKEYPLNDSWFRDLINTKDGRDTHILIELEYECDGIIVNIIQNVLDKKRQEAAMYMIEWLGSSCVHPEWGGAVYGPYVLEKIENYRCLFDRKMVDSQMPILRAMADSYSLKTSCLLESIGSTALNAGKKNIL